jgi:plasmid maintenance system killer protein
LFANVYSTGKPRFNKEIEDKFIKKVIQIEQAGNTNDLRALKSLHFEKLSGKLNDKYSVHVNEAFRIILRIEKDGNNTRVEIIYIEELNNHYSRPWEMYLTKKAMS